MNGDLWFGAATTLAGATLAGLISLALNRQQIRAARAQRAEDDQRERDRRSEDRRFTAYADFITGARTYRDAIRALTTARVPAKARDAIDTLAQATGPASAVVFLIGESERTHIACRAILATIGEAQTELHGKDTEWSSEWWAELNTKLARQLREFQVAVRDELGVEGISASVILDRGLAGRSHAGIPSRRQDG